MIDTFLDRQATDGDLFELEDVQTGEKKQYRIVSKATITQSGTDLSAATFNPILEEINGKLPKSGGTLTGALTTQDIVPDSDGVRNIGSDSKRYRELYADHGNLNGLMVTGPVTVQESVTATVGNFTATANVGGKEIWHPGNLKIATGESSIGDTGTGKSDTVTISLSSYGFTKRPVVFVSPNSTDLNTWAHVTQATATSFVVVGGRNSTNPGGFGFMWLAVQV